MYGDSQKINNFYPRTLPLVMGHVAVVMLYAIAVATKRLEPVTMICQK